MFFVLFSCFIMCNKRTKKQIIIVILTTLDKIAKSFIITAFGLRYLFNEKTFLLFSCYRSFNGWFCPKPEKFHNSMG